MEIKGHLNCHEGPGNPNVSAAELRDSVLYESNSQIAELREALLRVGRVLSWILMHHCSILIDMPEEHVDSLKYARLVLDKTEGGCHRS